MSAQETKMVAALREPTPVQSERRRFIKGAVLQGTALGLATAALPEVEAQSTKPLGQQALPAQPVLVPPNGQYATAPLTRPVLRVTAVQSRIRAVNPKNPKKEMQENLDHMIEMIDNANGFPSPQDLVCFHEQPIMGWGAWTRAEALRVAIEVPGPETEALGKKAKQYNCYISFGTYAVDKDWPGHLLLLGVLIGPDGKIAARHWKAHNVRDLRPDWGLFTTSIYDVLDRYTEMYGVDAVLPLARTEIGNITLTPTPGDPEIYRALAMKGMEISLRTASGGFFWEDPLAASMFNRIYTVIPNNSISPNNPGFAEFRGSGNTAIFAPRGLVLARAQSANEELVTATIPIAEFRKTHTIPEVPMAMLATAFNQYVPRYAPNLQVEYIPVDSADSARYFTARRSW